MRNIYNIYCATQTSAEKWQTVHEHMIADKSLPALLAHEQEALQK